MNKALKFALPVVFLVGAVVVWLLLFAFKPAVVHRPVEIKHPMVTVAEVSVKSMHIPVMTRGSVAPGTEIHLTSEVGGQVLEVSPNLASGGFFRKDETLVRIDTLEHDVNIKRAEASVAQARQQKAQAEAEKNARSRVQGGNRSQLATYEIQYLQAVANYDAARAELQAAKMQRSRTVIKAPFDGRVRMKSVDVGQYVRPGVQLAVIYAVDVAEIRLPLSDRQLALVDVPMSFDAEQNVRTPVRIMSEFGGRRYYWDGEVVRAEGGLDERNRLLYVVARVADPYALDPLQPGRPPLTAGFFVEAAIQGRHFENVVPVPRRALRNNDQIWVVDADNRLSRRNVDVIYKGKDSIYVRDGLQSGERVVLSQLDIAVEGMQVRAALEAGTEDSRVEQDLLSAGSGLGAARKGQPTAQPPTPAAQAKPGGNALQPQQFSREQLIAMAREAKQQYDQLDDTSKQKVKDLANQVQKQASAANERKMSPLADLIDQDVKQPDTAAAQPATNKQTTSQNQTPSQNKAAQDASATAQAQRRQASQQPEAGAAQQAESAAASSAKPRQPGASSAQGANVLSAVSAPQPLREAVQ